MVPWYRLGRLPLRSVLSLAVFGCVCWLGLAQGAEKRLTLFPDGERRLALVVGNSAYAGTLSLPNPVHDARLMTKTLRQLDFEVIERLDADEKTLKRAIQEFGQRIEQGGGETVSLFYYAGHAMEVNGVNYLLPLQAHIQRESDVDIEAVRADWVLRTMEVAGSRVNFIILDACRDNPVKRGRSANASRGLAMMAAPAGSLIAYSTTPGAVSVDGNGSNSPYTAALAQTMLVPGLTVEKMFKQVRIFVKDATDGGQITWENTSLTGEFYFKRTPTSDHADPVVPPATPPSVRPRPRDESGHQFSSRPARGETDQQVSPLPPASALTCKDILLKLSMPMLGALTPEETAFQKSYCRH